MKHFTDPYTPVEVRTESELLEWIKFRRNYPGVGNLQSKRIISRDMSKIRDVHQSRNNPLLNAGYTGNQYGHNKVYIWYGIIGSRRMYVADYDID